MPLAVRVPTNSKVRRVDARAPVQAYAQAQGQEQVNAHAPPFEATILSVDDTQQQQQQR